MTQLTNATLPYALQLANKGWKQALRDNAESMRIFADSVRGLSPRASAAGVSTNTTTGRLNFSASRIARIALR